MIQCHRVHTSNDYSMCMAEMFSLNFCSTGETYAKENNFRTFKLIFALDCFQNPGSCLYTETQSILSCDGSHQHTKRLCPCA